MFADTFEKLLHRPADSHKYTFGHVLVIGGSLGMVGAPLLAGQAALRTGAGLVTIAAAAAVIDKIAGHIPEVMTKQLPDRTAAACAALSSWTAERHVTVIVFGPGMVADSHTRALLTHCLTFGLPLVIDGGGLGVLPGHLDVLALADASHCVLTPHAGEFQRLAGSSVPADRAARCAMAADFVRQYPVTLVLKGNPTFVAQGSETVYENTTGTPALATAGTGDVLSGIIGGLIAQGVALPLAARLAPYLHGLAGQVAEAAKTQPGVIASDLIEAISAVYRDHRA